MAIIKTRRTAKDKCSICHREEQHVWFYQDTTQINTVKISMVLSKIWLNKIKASLLTSCMRLLYKNASL